MSKARALLITFFSLVSSCLATEANGSPPSDAAWPPPNATGARLDGHTFIEWRDFLAPKPGDAPWLRIPWLPTFAEGIRNAQKEDKPLLLWVMNGHPLGCT